MERERRPAYRQDHGDQSTVCMSLSSYGISNNHVGSGREKGEAIAKLIQVYRLII